MSVRIMKSPIANPSFYKENDSSVTEKKEEVAKEENLTEGEKNFSHKLEHERHVPPGQSVGKQTFGKQSLGGMTSLEMFSPMSGIDNKMTNQDPFLKSLDIGPAQSAKPVAKSWTKREVYNEMFNPMVGLKGICF